MTKKNNDDGITTAAMAGIFVAISGVALLVGLWYVIRLTKRQRTPPLEF